jgi:ABC-2 type transport system permease protein
MNQSMERTLTGAVRRIGTMISKELLQLRRDHLTMATLVVAPLLQLVLFGYAINVVPRDLPTAVLMQETSDVGRSILVALENTRYFKITHVVHNVADFDYLLASGKILFGVEIPAEFERAVRRGDQPALLIAADATDPQGVSAPLAALEQLPETALTNDHAIPYACTKPFEVRLHRRYNPDGSTQLNTVPALLGVILMTIVLVQGSLTVTRESERGTMERLLSMPVRPVEIMLGKIITYILIGLVETGAILSVGIALFDVPMLGDFPLLIALTTLFILTTVSIGYTFSTVSQNQLQAGQLAMMFFLPNILLSGFAFPFAGMPVWAQWVGECLPLTHFLRIARAIMLKGSTLPELQSDALALVAMTLLAMIIAMARFRQTLD